MNTEVHLPDATLPTLTILQATIPKDLDAHQVARDWFKEFSAHIYSKDANAVADLFLSDAWWRDMLAFTWDFRTFHSQNKISEFLHSQLSIVNISSLKLRDEFLGLQQPFPDLAWINALFDFETNVGIGSGILRLVPTSSGAWKAHLVYTNLEDLKGFPEKVGNLRNREPTHGLWFQEKQKADEFADKHPSVIIVGSGQSGLEVAARLKALDVSTLIIEKNARVGDNWRDRYDALCLHDTVHFDHMPYMPFPSTWPRHAPAHKLANWLESYAEALDLSVWLSSTVVSASQAQDKKWHVKVKRGVNGDERKFVVNHVVFATGFAFDSPKPPEIPGLDKFKGRYMHSSQYKRGLDHIGKKVVVVGSGTSGHDISADCYHHGLDITMVQRGPTYVMSIKNGFGILIDGLYSEGGLPIDIADRLQNSSPSFLSLLFGKHLFQVIEGLDKTLLEGLKNVGFKTTRGPLDAGFLLLAFNRGGGYYFDTGASQLIIDRKIKLKNDSTISEITETGIKFDDDSVISADVIIFATGLGDLRDPIRRICGEEIANVLKPIWGLDPEGEMQGVWRDLGVPGLWCMVGGLAHCRFYSKHVALQIKAMEEGKFGVRYSP